MRGPGCSKWPKGHLLVFFSTSRFRSQARTRSLTAAGHSAALLRMRAKPDTERWLRLSVAEGLLATPLVVIATPGNFLLTALLVTTWGLPPDIFGALTSLRFWCNLVQVGLSPLLVRHWPARTFYLVFVVLNTAAWAGLAALIVVAPQTGPNLAVLIGLLLVAHLTGALAGVGWASWVHEWIPSQIHAAFFAHRLRWTEIASVAFAALTALVLGLSAQTARLFALVLGGAVVLRAAGWVLSLRILGGTGRLGETALLAQQLASVRASRPLARLAVFAMAVGFSITTVTAFVPVFMLQRLGYDAADLAWFVALATLTGALVYPVWGRVARRVGYRGELFASLGLWVLGNLVWCSASAATPWLAMPGWLLLGAATAGITLGKLGLLLKLVPPQAKTMAIGAQTALTALASGAGPVIGGLWLASSALDGSSGFPLLFAAQPVVIAIAMAALWSINPPEVRAAAAERATARPF